MVDGLRGGLGTIVNKLLMWIHKMTRLEPLNSLQATRNELQNECRDSFARQFLLGALVRTRCWRDCFAVLVIATLSFKRFLPVGKSARVRLLSQLLIC